MIIHKGRTLEQLHIGGIGGQLRNRYRRTFGYRNIVPRYPTGRSAATRCYVEGGTRTCGTTIAILVGVRVGRHWKAVRDGFFAVCASVIPNEHFDPAIPVIVALRTQHMPRLVSPRSLFSFDNEERMTILLLLVGRCRSLSVVPLLTSDLRTSYGDRA